MVASSLCRLPGLVEAAEVHSLKVELAAAGEGRMLVLQLGGGADDWGSSAHAIVEHNRNLQSICRYLALMLGIPVLPIRLGARSNGAGPSAAGDDVPVPGRSDDGVNDNSAGQGGRGQDAGRMLRAYNEAALVLQVARQNQLKTYTSHEGADLHFEEALVRRGVISKEFYASSGHLLRLESSKVYLGSDYLEFLRGVVNPISIRVDPRVAPPELLSCYMVLNPHKEPGKIVVATRAGNEQSALKRLIRVFREAAAPVVWMCEPPWESGTQQGSSSTVAGIIAEVEQVAQCHADEGSRLAGLCLESGVGGPDGGAVLSRTTGLDLLETLHVCSDFARAYGAIG